MLSRRGKLLKTNVYLGSRTSNLADIFGVPGPPNAFGEPYVVTDIGGKTIDLGGNELPNEGGNDFYRTFQYATSPAGMSFISNQSYTNHRKH